MTKKERENIIAAALGGLEDRQKERDRKRARLVKTSKDWAEREKKIKAGLEPEPKKRNKQYRGES